MVFICRENIVCSLCLLHISNAFQTTFIMKASIISPSQTLFRSILIWFYSVCNVYQQMVKQTSFLMIGLKRINMTHPLSSRRTGKLLWGI